MLSTELSSYRPISRPASARKGMLPNMMPKPIGTRRSGSKSFLMASHMNMPPTIIMSRLGMVALAKPVYDRKSMNFVEINSMNPMALSDCDKGGTFHHRVAFGY